MTTRTDAQDQQRALERGLRWIMGVWPLIIIIAAIFGAGGYAMSFLNGFTKTQDAQGQTIQVHAGLIQAVSLSEATDRQEIQIIQVQFAGIKQLLIDLQNGRKTDLSTLPASSRQAKNPDPSEFDAGSAGG